MKPTHIITFFYTLTFYESKKAIRIKNKDKAILAKYKLFNGYTLFIKKDMIYITNGADVQRLKEKDFIIQTIKQYIRHHLKQID